MVNSLPDVSARFGVWASAAPAPLRRRPPRASAAARADCGTRAFCVRAGCGTLRRRTGCGTFAFRVRACGCANVHARVRARSCANGCAATHDRADARSRFRFPLHNRSNPKTQVECFGGKKEMWRGGKVLHRFRPLFRFLPMPSSCFQLHFHLLAICNVATQCGGGDVLTCCCSFLHLFRSRGAISLSFRPSLHANRMQCVSNESVDDTNAYLRSNNAPLFRKRCRKIDFGKRKATAYVRAAGWGGLPIE
mgnify:CR=1 FL=1